MATPKKGGMGAMMGIILIIALLALGGYYFFTTQNEKRIADEAAKEAAAIENKPDASLEALMKVSNSNAASSIEADLNATDFGSSEADLSGAASQF